ncbi:MAG: hypothetical protein M1838_000935 [Thelocarpon superellum]|nr:MAG: hypothetical protein M1838_000935 [Thelocarpon superellum]
MAPSSSVVVRISVGRDALEMLKCTKAKIKVQLKLSISRLRMVQQKDTAIAKQQRRAMAQLLEVGKEESARIRVENIIRSDITTELHEILELYCELLLARIGLLEAKDCDPGLEEAVKSLIYAGPRIDIKELQQTRQLLIDKYGKDFALQAIDNTDGKVADRVLQKLRLEPPPQELVTLYLTEIARTYGVDWPKRKESEPASEDGENEDDDDDDDDDASGGQIIKGVEEPLTTAELSKATPPRDLGPRSPVSIAPPKGSTENVSPKINLPPPPDLKPSAKASGLKKQIPTSDGPRSGADVEGGKKTSSTVKPVGGKIPDVDELAARFAALKK